MVSKGIKGKRVIVHFTVNLMILVAGVKTQLIFAAKKITLIYYRGVW
jgi:hypothetical protein